MSAHEGFDGVGVESVSEGVHVCVELFVAAEVGFETSDWYVRDGVKMGEFNAESVVEFAMVVVFECGLVGWQRGATGVVYEVEGQFGGCAVADGVQTLDDLDAFVEYAFASLLVYVFFCVARERCD